MGDLLCPYFIEYDSFHKYLCVKVGGLVLVAEAGKIFLTRAFLEEIFAVSNFDALGSWGNIYAERQRNVILRQLFSMWKQFEAGKVKKC